MGSAAPESEKTASPSPHQAGHETGSHAHGAAPAPAKSKGFRALVIGSIGVVYGDIGTSPLYALREAVHAAGGMDAARLTILGVLSLIIWALLLVVTLKYVVILLRADNNGEGGTLSLMALTQRALGRRSDLIFILGIIGASLFYGDSIITPAISVLSAVEGVKLIAPGLESWVVPLTIFIILMLFMFQSRGTARVAGLFGPIMMAWFALLAVMGLWQIIQDPEVLAAFNPVYAAHLLLSHGKVAFFILGAIFLAVTGGEALYADLGHFGRTPIRFAWLWVVLPALVLNYLGQGALVLQHPETLQSPFFHMAPDILLIPLVLLATAATVIASQAVITGTYSLTRQAIQLGLLPRMQILHTSEHHHGQIYMPRVTLWLAIGVVFLVMMFGSSSNLAAAYGIAVTGTMAIDSILAFVVVWKLWHVRPWIAALLLMPLLAIDMTFFASNSLKFFDGGWLPLLLGGFLMVVMLTWIKGSRILFQRQRRSEMLLSELISALEGRIIARVPGTAVFLTADLSTAPTALLHNLKHNKVLHEQNFILSIIFENAPRVKEDERAEIKRLNDDFTQVILHFGYMETPNVLKALSHCRKLGWKFDIMQTTFFLSRRSIRPAAKSGMPIWQDKLFITMTKNADTATEFFRIPVDQVMEVGTHVKI